jgi:hypothetical protein
MLHSPSWRSKDKDWLHGEFNIYSPPRLRLGLASLRNSDNYAEGLEALGEQLLQPARSCRSIRGRFQPPRLEPLPTLRQYESQEKVKTLIAKRHQEQHSYVPRLHRSIGHVNLDREHRGLIEQMATTKRQNKAFKKVTFLPPEPPKKKKTMLGSRRRK